jgi:hypothetical protein
MYCNQMEVKYEAWDSDARQQKQKSWRLLTIPPTKPSTPLISILELPCKQRYNSSTHTTARTESPRSVLGRLHGLNYEGELETIIQGQSTSGLQSSHRVGCNLRSKCLFIEIYYWLVKRTRNSFQYVNILSFLLFYFWDWLLCPSSYHPFLWLLPSRISA